MQGANPCPNQILHRAVYCRAVLWRLAMERFESFTVRSADMIWLTVIKNRGNKMAYKIIYTCDRCKKTYTENDILPYGYPQLSIYYKHKDSNEHNDLCIQCQTSLKKWFYNRED